MLQSGDQLAPDDEPSQMLAFLSLPHARSSPHLARKQDHHAEHVSAHRHQDVRPVHDAMHLRQRRPFHLLVLTADKWSPEVTSGTALRRTYRLLTYVITYYVIPIDGWQAGLALS